MILQILWERLFGYLSDGGDGTLIQQGSILDAVSSRYTQLAERVVPLRTGAFRTTSGPRSRSGNTACRNPARVACS